MDFNNTGLTQKGFTKPGTRDIFDMSEIEVYRAEEGKSNALIVTFENSDSKFTHRFYTSQGALPRLQDLHLAAYNSLLEGQITEEQLANKLKGKKLALKVTGKISDKGGVFADLPFGGFAKSVDKLADLFFTTDEQATIDKCIAQLERGSSAIQEAKVETEVKADELPF